MAAKPRDDVRKHLAALELEPGATMEEVKRAYRDLARVWHPDRFEDPALAARAANRLKAINVAYAWLRKHPEALRRAALAARIKPSVPAVPPPPPPPPRSPAPPPEPAADPPDHPRSITWLQVLPWSLLAATTALLVALLVLRPEPQPRDPIRLPLPPRAEPQGHGMSRAPETDPRQTSATLEQWMAVLQAPPTPAVPQPTSRVEHRAAKEYFTLGSSADEVLTAQGAPSELDGRNWAYGLSRVYFEDGRVVGWHSFRDHPLKVKLTAAAEMPAAGSFTLGSSKDEVIAVQGTPSGLSDRVWHYGGSTVYFEEDRVVSWSSRRDEPLRVVLNASPGFVKTRDYFTIGSTRDEVLAVQGTPTEINMEIWRYGLSRVVFADGRVKDWSSARSDPLHARKEGPTEERG